MEHFYIYIKLSNFIKAFIEKYFKKAINKGKVIYLTYVKIHLLYLSNYSME